MGIEPCEHGTPCLPGGQLDELGRRRGASPEAEEPQG